MRGASAPIGRPAYPPRTKRAPISFCLRLTKLERGRLRRLVFEDEKREKADKAEYVRIKKAIKAGVI